MIVAPAHDPDKLHVPRSASSQAVDGRFIGTTGRDNLLGKDRYKAQERRLLSDGSIDEPSPVPGNAPAALGFCNYIFM